MNDRSSVSHDHSSKSVEWLLLCVTAKLPAQCPRRVTSVELVPLATGPLYSQQPTLRSGHPKPTLSPTSELTRRSNQIARRRIRRFEPDMPSQADWSPHRGISQIWFGPALLRSEVVMLARAVTIACVTVLTLTASVGPSRARSVTECTKDRVCYCVDQDLKVEI